MSKDAKRLLASRCLLLLLAMIAFAAATTWLDAAPHLHSAPYTRALRLSLLNALPGILLALVLLTLTRRLLLSFGLALALEMLLYSISRLKEKYLAVPLLPNDFYMLGQLQSGHDIFTKYVPPWGSLVAGSLLAVAALALLLRSEPPFLARSVWRRAMIAVAPLALLVTCICGVSWWGAIYNSRSLTWAPWDAHVMRLANGMIGNLVLLHVQLDKPPQPEDLEALHQTLRQLGVSTLARPSAYAKPDLPDIVVIQSESLFDPKILTGFEGHDEVLPVVDAWRKYASHGRLFVPTFGGLTIRTEFETLTGLPLSYFPEMTYPYLQVRTSVIPSIVQLLKAYGYRTVALHPNNPDFWNRSQTFRAMGFDRFVSLNQFSRANRQPVYGQYLADSAMTNEVMETLPTSGCPMFLFVVSIEAHGPYKSDAGLNVKTREAMPVPKGTPSDMIAPWQRYLLHIHHADHQLGRLLQFLKHRERSTLVLFYGDHLPGLKPVFRAAGFKNGFPAIQQAGLWLLIDPKHPKPEPERDVAAWMLPGMLLKRIGIDDSPYFSLTRKVGAYLLYQTRALGSGISPPATSVGRRLDAEMRNAAFIRLHQTGTVFDIPGTSAHQCAMSAAQKAASHGMAIPLTAAEVGIDMRLAKTPVLSADGKAVQVAVEVTNRGDATLTSTGEYPVHLGAHLLDPDGKNVNNDFARASLAAPLVAGGAEETTLSLSASSLVGHSVAILPVQERVAWFDQWGVAPLKIGPFMKCGKHALELCLPSGKPVRRSR